MTHHIHTLESHGARGPLFWTNSIPSGERPQGVPEGEPLLERLDVLTFLHMHYELSSSGLKAAARESVVYVASSSKRIDAAAHGGGGGARGGGGCLV